MGRGERRQKMLRKTQVRGGELFCYVNHFVRPKITRRLQVSIASDLAIVPPNGPKLEECPLYPVEYWVNCKRVDLAALAPELALRLFPGQSAFGQTNQVQAVKLQALTLLAVVLGHPWVFSCRESISKQVTHGQANEKSKCSLSILPAAWSCRMVWRLPPPPPAPPIPFIRCVCIKSMNLIMN